jgi:Protein of unknown function (DUF2922).
MAKTRTLRMGFETSSGKNLIYSITNVKSDLEASEVAGAMDALIMSPILTHELTAKIGAEVVEREVRDLF